MSRSRVALLGGPAFFVPWFIGGTLLWSATGGEPQAGRSEFPEVLLANQSGALAGATLLMLAGASILWFAAGIRDRTRSDHVSTSCLHLDPRVAGLEIAKRVAAAVRCTLGGSFDRLGSILDQIPWPVPFAGGRT